MLKDSHQRHYNMTAKTQPYDKFDNANLLADVSSVCDSSLAELMLFEPRVTRRKDDERS